MNKPKPDLVILPFKALLPGTSIHLTFEQAIEKLSKGNGAKVQIERSYPGALRCRSCPGEQTIKPHDRVATARPHA